jgi:uncharacterized protein YkwD
MKRFIIIVSSILFFPSLLHAMPSSDATRSLHERATLLFSKKTEQERLRILQQIQQARKRSTNRFVQYNLLLLANTLVALPTSVSVEEPIVDDTLVWENILRVNDDTTIDLLQLQKTWLGWVNALRKDRGLASISHNTVLDATAKKRSEEMSEKWLVDHKRTSKSSYYAYYEIEEWFRDLGVEFKNVSRATFVENIGRPYLKCPSGDCTDAASKAMRTTFDFYVAEAWTKNDAHRRTLIHPLMKIMGLGIVVDSAGKRLYFTTHYGTELK